MIEICSLRDLRNACKHFGDLADVLLTYVGINEDDFVDMTDIFDILEENDMLYVMSNENNMSEHDMKLWMDDHICDPVKCSIIMESGPAGGCPVVEVKCADKVFHFDWCYE